MKEEFVAFILSRINMTKFSDLIKKSGIFSVAYKYISQKLIDYNFPRHIFIETTNACNLRCKMCARNLKPIETGSMDFNLFKKIIDEAANYGPRTFSLHLYGEPLLSPNLPEMLDYIKKKNKKNTILLTTNGVFLKEEIAQKIIDDYIDKIIISTHSSDEKNYQKITGVDKLKEVEENIKSLIKLKETAKAKKPLIYLRMVVEKNSEKEIGDFVKKWKNFPVMIDIREAHNFGGGIDIKKETNNNKKRYPCYHLWLSPGINWDGKMSICCSDPNRLAILGDIKKFNISELWKDETLKKYRNYHLKGEYDKMPACQNCNVWSVYPNIFFNR